MASLLEGLDRMRVSAWLVFAATSGAAGCVSAAIHPPSQSAAKTGAGDEKRGMLVRAYASGLSGVRATNPNLKLSVGRDPAMGDEIRPNPYFQPPGAKTSVPIDVSEVNGIAFAPQDQASGRLAISQIAVVR